PPRLLLVTNTQLPVLAHRTCEASDVTFGKFRFLPMPDDSNGERGFVEQGRVWGQGLDHGRLRASHHHQLQAISENSWKIQETFGIRHLHHHHRGGAGSISGRFDLLLHPPAPSGPEALNATID
ncbi:hypothetical protein ANANG_G00099260, partial [Anguilla anguilla]